jgi:hypothetical protein
MRNLQGAFDWRSTRIVDVRYNLQLNSKRGYLPGVILQAGILIVSLGSLYHVHLGTMLHAGVLRKTL